MTGQNPQAGQFQGYVTGHDPHNQFAGLLSKSVAEVIQNAAQQTAKAKETIVKPQHPSIIVPDEGGEAWVHKPIFYTKIGQTAEFEISKDAAGWWIKASIGCSLTNGGKVYWIREFLHSNEKEPKIFRLYARNSDPKVPMVDIARRHRMFPLGCDVRLAQ